jgi:heme/copper-type cytochrome/quinol oxidase subunit 1
MLSQVMVWHAGMEMYFRYYGMVWSILSIGFLGFIVWAHHMFSIGMDTDSKCYFAAATIVIRIPTGVKIFSWIRHFCTGCVELTITIAWGVLFIWLFTLGGVTGLVLSAASIDLLLHDLLCGQAFSLCSFNGCRVFLNNGLVFLGLCFHRSWGL